jgi:hypothetical protein
MFDLENSNAGQADGKPSRRSPATIWLRVAAIFGLTSASVFFVMICPCDSPWQTPVALVLLLFSLAACLAAAFVLYRLRQFAGNATSILRGVAAVGVVIVVRFVELKLAIDCVAWLAARSQ